MSVKVYFHSDGSFLAFSGRMGHKVYKGDKIQTQVTFQNVERLERIIEDPYEAHPGTTYQKTCAHHDFDTCLYGKLFEAMKHRTEDECTAPWMPNNTNICTKRSDINSTFMITRQRFTNQENDCHSSCRSVAVSVQGKNYRKYANRKYGELYVYYGFEVSKITERYYFTFYQLLANFGGYIGLFLGYSLFSLVNTIRQLAEKKLANMEFI